uniref:Dynein assembly factor 5 n=2 Tax=Schistocephalus solidus TaxID=70667 RepID=A0A0X3P0A3_SCHSO
MTFLVTESSRTLSLLSSESKAKRRESLEQITHDIDENVPNSQISEVEAYCSYIVPHVVMSISDPVESHRERALQILFKLCNVIEDSSPFLPHVMPIFVKRFTEKEMMEVAEEIRLFSLRLLLNLLLKIKKDSSYTPDYCLIVQHALTDSYPDIKIVCCDLLSELSTKFSAAFYRSAEPILKPLLKNVTHQQHRVRLATVKAIGAVFAHCNGEFVDYTIAPLTQRLFDASIPVRKAVISVVGDWLLNLMDRYSYHGKLVPLMLSGLIDEAEEIRDEAESLWFDVGVKYQKENEDQLKDKIDFDSGVPSWYPAGQMRPNFGCREIIHRTASRILPGLCKDLSDWQEETRKKASGLLPILLLHLENAVTQHTQVLISGISAGVADGIQRTISTNAGGGTIYLLLMSPDRGIPNIGTLTNENPSGTSANSRDGAPSSEASEALQVLKQLYLATRYVSCFVSPNVWWKLAYESARRCNETTSPTSLAGNLFMLANLISGASTLDMTSTATDKPELPCFAVRIAAYLTSEELLCCAAFANKAGLLECANALCALVEEMTSRFLVAKEAAVREQAGEGVAAPDASAMDNLTFPLKGNWDNICIQLVDEVFFLLMSISANWNPDTERTEFAVAFNEQVGRLLCVLARSVDALCSKPGTSARKCECHHEEDDTPEGKEEQIIAAARRRGQILEQLYARELPKVLKRLDEDRVAQGGWYPRSTGLAIFTHTVLAAGPALLAGLEPPCKCCKPLITGELPENSLLPTLQLLEQGCKLNQPLTTKGSGDEKSHPMSIASEAELHLRGLLLLVRLTEHARVRLLLTQPKLFRYCMNNLILPSLVWRGGRTAEAMRKAAGTSLVALLAAVVPLSSPALRPQRAVSLYPPPEALNKEEEMLDDWLNKKVEPTKNTISDIMGKNGLLSRRIRFVEVKTEDKLPNLGLVSAASPKLMSQLLARLGSMLTDDLEATRLLACTGLTLFFGGIFAGGGKHVADTAPPVTKGPPVPQTFIRSPAWFLPLAAETDKQEVDISGYGDKMPGLSTPLPGSIGDQVYRFYPCLVKALDDVSDEVRLRVADVFVTWFWVVAPNLLSVPPPVPKSEHTPVPPPEEWKKVNPAFSGVLEDLLSSVVIHLDDTNSLIRTAVARIVLRISRVDTDTVRKVLLKAKDCHRSPQLCESLLETLNWQLK